MKLQFNARGAWKDVLTIDDDFCDYPIALEGIVDAAAGLLEACGRSSVSFRIVAGDVVMLICDKYGRRDYPFGRGET